MLSTNVIQTLTSVIDGAVDLVGFKIKNEKNEEISASGFLSKILNDALNKIFGAANVAEFQLKLAEANRIYQSVSNMLDDVQNMFDSSKQLLELGANNTGKIGNALKKAGVVFENAFDWMSDDNRTGTSKQRKLERFKLGLENIDDKFSTFNSVIGEVKTIKDSVNSLKETTKEFEAFDQERITHIFDSEKDINKRSQLNTDIKNTDLIRSEPESDTTQY